MVVINRYWRQAHNTMNSSINSMNGKKQALKGLAFRLISLLENTVRVFDLENQKTI